MRALIISDIHANLIALEAVLNDAQEIDAYWCLGDIVGYGPDPDLCVSRIRNLPNLTCIVGNHDAAALHRIDTGSFNPEARLALHWTRSQLSPKNQEFLTQLPQKVVVGNVTLTHGSPRHPVWEYLLDTRTAAFNFEHFDTDFCLVGHTHLPVIYTQKAGNETETARLMVPDPDKKLRLEPRAILNPGSVGQPRDRDPRASYLIYDDEEGSWTYRRVRYDIEEVQRRMREAGLPDRHINRLESGW